MATVSPSFYKRGGAERRSDVRKWLTKMEGGGTLGLLILISGMAAS